MLGFGCFRVRVSCSGSGFVSSSVLELGIRVSCFEIRVPGFVFRISCFGIRVFVFCFGHRDSCLAFLFLSFEFFCFVFWDSGFVFQIRVSGFGFRDSGFVFRFS